MTTPSRQQSTANQSENWENDSSELIGFARLPEIILVVEIPVVEKVDGGPVNDTLDQVPDERKIAGQKHFLLSLQTFQISLRYYFLFV